MNGAAKLPKLATWLEVDASAKPTAVALLIHGLNFRPDRMVGIAKVLSAQGVGCLNLSLRGHACEDDASPPETRARRQLAAFQSVSRELWLSEARAAHALARARADECGVPLLLVGFSLGAAVGCDLASEPGSDARFDAMILFAPAFEVHWYTKLIRSLSPFPGLTLKSFSPEDYAANSGTPIAAYNALFESIAALKARKAREHAPDALIFIDPNDELVSFDALRALCESPGRGHWTLVATPKSLRSGRRDYHHLIIDEPSLGAAGWAEVERRVHAFLSDLSTRHPRSAPDQR